MVQYEIENKIIVITGCSDDEHDVYIPEYIENMPVGKIKANSFNEMNNLRRVVFPKNLKFIGAFAFAGCKNLSEVMFAEGIEIIEDWAFISCNIKSVSLPSSLKSIGENAFTGNICKKEVDLFNLELNKQKKRRIPKKDNMAIFPVNFINDVSKLPNDIITDWAKLYSNDVISFENKEKADDSLILPILFDGSSFLLSLYYRKTISEFKIILSNETKKIIGLYKEDDPDFIVAKIEVIADDMVIGEVYAKMPYLEEATFEIEDIVKTDDKGFRYFIKCKANLCCYGNGNLNREFAFDLFKHLEGKYKSLNELKLITAMELETVNKELEFSEIDTIVSYMKQVTGAPILTYMFKAFDAVREDKELNRRAEVEKFFYDYMKNIYHRLSNYESFESACFDLDEPLNYLYSLCELDEESFNNKYKINVCDDEGNVIDKSKYYYYRTRLVDIDSNFELYADYLKYMYDVMAQKEEEFQMLPFKK